jgi:hypothetical protein
VELFHQVEGAVLLGVNQQAVNDQPIFQSEETQQHIKGTKGSRFRPTAFRSLMKLVCFFANQSAATS